MRQDDAFALLKMGKNVFLTGAAGSGKTFILNKYIRYLKDNQVSVAITASTGIAATHLQGCTIHSWSGIGVRHSLQPEDIEKLQNDKRIARNYKKTKVLIIDEISMLHQQQLDMVNAIARAILDANLPFGGIQVVVCGDFFQLPPVTTNGGNKEKLFAFEAASWAEADFQVCYLEEQHRQGNDPLLTVLNDIRQGTAGEHTKVPLRTRYKKEPVGSVKATKLYSRNINVDAINEQALSLIHGHERTFTMKTSGFAALVEGLKKSCLALEELRLKIGAEVMFIKNDTTGRFVNGTRCVVVGFEKIGERCPIVQTMDGQIIVAHHEEWKYEDNGVVRATLLQVPLRLAWAITIHKSQGMTLDAAEMDLGDAFEPGMGYVALSRVRRLDGLKLMNLNEMALKVNPAVLQQDVIFKEQSVFTSQYLANLSAEEIADIERKTLVLKFGGVPAATVAGQVIKKQDNKLKKVKKDKGPLTHLKTLALLQEQLSIDAIAEKREISPGTVLSHIEKLKSLKLLDEQIMNNLRSAIAAHDFEVILAEFKQSAEGWLQPIHEKLGAKYSFMTLKVVRLFI
ncbi:MAG TPA: AAA family ATPase [Gammaproteobacteria bacterium]|jgi:hypothetical protein|nr:AAA family ATPase [Gammaproteobacteria bacterium]